MRQFSTCVTMQCNDVDNYPDLVSCMNIQIRLMLDGPFVNH